MFQTINETLEWIHGLEAHGIRPGTERMAWMLEKIGHPERRIRSVHVGGTNGKGSTVSFISHIYQKAGLKVGTFTSPYITTFNERIMVNGTPISDDDLIQAANVVFPLTRAVAEETGLGEPTEFETVTMLSFVYFGRMNVCDLVIFEVGLGGRLDSTNVIYPLVSVITNVGMDHMKILGGTIEKIAFEKAGIIKNGVGVVTAAEHPDALSVIRRTATERRSNLYVIGKDFTVSEQGHDEEGERFRFDSLYMHLPDLASGLKGVHQLKNAAAALMTVDYLGTTFGIQADEAEIRAGLAETTWAGRFECLSRQPLILVDGAHNVQGTEALVRTVKRYYPNRRIHLLFAALKNKKYDRMLQMIGTVAEDLTLTTFDDPRAAGSDLLFEAADHGSKSKNPDWKDALNRLIAHTKKDEAILVCGSLYFIARVRSYLLDRSHRTALHLA